MFQDLTTGVQNIRNERDQRQRSIDFNRGVTIRRHNATGMQIFMYKDAPGAYMNAFGKPVHEALAEQAGFPVAILRKEKDKLERIGRARAEIEAEFERTGPIKELVQEQDGYKLYLRGLGRYDVEDPDGNKLNEFPLPEQVARNLMSSFAPVVAAAE